MSTCNELSTEDTVDESQLTKGQGDHCAVVEMWIKSNSNTEKR